MNVQRPPATVDVSNGPQDGQFSTEPTRLASTNNEVKRFNDDRLSKLLSASVHFPAEDTGHDPFLSTLQKNCSADQRLTLKQGAQVILLKNIDPKRGLVNGAR